MLKAEAIPEAPYRSRVHERHHPYHDEPVAHSFHQKLVTESYPYRQDRRSDHGSLKPRTVHQWQETRCDLLAHAHCLHVLASRHQALGFRPRHVHVVLEVGILLAWVLQPRELRE